MRFVAAIVLALTLVGCYFGTLLPIDQKLRETYLTRTYAHPPDKCYEATLRALEDIKTPVDKADHEVLTIWTGRGVVTEVAYVSGGQYSAAAQKFTTEHRLTLKIEPAAQGCTVRTTSYEMWTNNQKLEQANVDYCEPAIFRPFMQAIQDQLDRGL